MTITERELRQSLDGFAAHVHAGLDKAASPSPD